MDFTAPEGAILHQTSAVVLGLVAGTCGASAPPSLCLDQCAVFVFEACVVRRGVIQFGQLGVRCEGTIADGSYDGCGGKNVGAVVDEADGGTIGRPMGGKCYVVFVWLVVVGLGVPVAVSKLPGSE